LPEPTARALLRHLPEVEARRAYGAAQMAWVTYEMTPGKKQQTEVSDWLPPFARDASDQKRSVPPAWRADLSVGASGGWLRQELYDAVMTVCEV
jgi:hypothetical protein